MKITSPMKPLILFKITIPVILIPLLLACFGFAPMVQAVGPDTDGSIPGSNNGDGIGVLVSRTTGVWNTGTGFEALSQLTAGNQNTATGLRALSSDINGGFNTATGVFSLFSNTNGFFNSATGAYSLANNISGDYNTATGYSALYRNTASFNTATGFAALYKNTTGLSNTANGFQALNSNTTGFNNTANGVNALLFNTGDNNTATGVDALSNNTTGSQNTALGKGAGSNVITADHVICIGHPGLNASSSCFIGQIFGRPSSGGTAVFINSNGFLGTITSSRRFKEEIKPMEQASEALFALKPVTFRYKKGIDPQGIPQFGLVAEEVEAVNPDLVVRDKEGKVNTVRYEAINAMLLNEFLKEHRKVEEHACKVAEQETTMTQLKATVAQQQKDFQVMTTEQKKDFESKIAHQQKEIQVLTAALKEQTAQIQQVSTQLELSKFATGRIRRGGLVAQVVGNQR